jgi:hypothetical protein
MNNELERVWKEALVTKIEKLSQYLPGGKHENL